MHCNLFAFIIHFVSANAVLSLTASNSSASMVHNYTKNVGKVCGAQFCPGVSAAENPNLQPPDPKQIQMLAAIFLGCMAAACLLVAFFVDSLKR